MFDARNKTSARREHLTGVLRGQEGLAKLGLKPIAQRRSRPAQPAPQEYRMRNQQPDQHEQEYYTDEDEALQLGLRRRPVPDIWPEARPARRGGNGGGYDQRQPRSRFRLHPLLWLGVGMLLVLGFWQLTTSGAAWWTTHIADPGQYGPTQGNVINAVLGGGDSSASPTKIVALNNDGQIQLILIPSNKLAKVRMVDGPDLVKMTFPDPAKAVLSIQAGDYNGDGKIDLKITVWSDLYTLPFHRYGLNFLLPGDGKGGFSQGQPA